MSVKSKSSKAIDRPFDKAVLAKARQISQQYQIVLNFEDGEWYGHGLELPGARADGKTVAGAVAAVRDAMVTMVAYMIEEGQTIPPLASEGNRTVQINIRVTPEEEAVLESRTRAKGFRGLSDFIRATVLAETD